jgi:hypothetical protein
MRPEKETPTGGAALVGVLFGHHRPVAMGAAMESEWPADWMFYTGHKTGLGVNLLWVVGIACAVVRLWRR